MHSLILHPHCSPGSITSLQADLRRSSSGFDVEFVLAGEISGIVLPGHAMAARADELWKTTCFEVFWQPVGGNAYREFNFAPSSRWASYAFEDYREGMQRAEVGAISTASSHAGREMVFKASVATPLSTPAMIGLSAVIEDRNAGLQYWALAFPDGKPDFHSEECRTVRIEG